VVFVLLPPISYVEFFLAYVVAAVLRGLMVGLGVLVVTGWKLANPRLFRSMWQEGIQQFLPFFATVVAIVLTDLLSGVLIGLAVSIAFILKSNLLRGFRIFEETHVGGMIHRIEFSNQATFLNRAQLADTFARFKKGDHVLIDARLSDYVDGDIISMIREFTQESAPARGITVSLVGFKERYPLEDLIQYVDVSTREVQSSLNPGRVLTVLKEGNERFVTGKRLHRDLIRQVDATAAGQHPMAAVLSCIDSRAPAELLFDLGIGDIFSVRLAGNVASPKALGSLEFACRVAGSKLVVVLGHTRCGAVKATCDFIDKGIDPVAATGLTNLPSITEPISEAVHAETATKDQRTAANLEFVDRVAAINVRNTIRWIHNHSPTLASMSLNGEIAIVGAMYDVSTGRVEFLDGVGFASRPNG
jgi:carbonic anhydrase/SulP family sulfate permease